jgi:hypothetical protein
MVLIKNKKIRVRILWSLIFSFLLTSCSEPGTKDQSLSVQWEANKAIGIVVPLRLLTTVPEDSIEQLLHVHLIKGNSPPPILGKYTRSNDAFVFYPLIPLTRGLKYEVRLADKLLGEIEIPKPESINAPVVLAVYPTRDTVPLNLLKFYVEFSKPMQEGQALEHIILIRNDRDTIPSVFLDLQPELWNNDRTTLTLWLDPGRIKRDLQPNKTMGPPLQAGSHYQLIIQQDWQDIEGTSLPAPVHKNFIVGAPDDQSPDQDKWTIRGPKAGSIDQLQVDFHESLDYVLLKNTFRVVDTDGNPVKGTIHINKQETSLSFQPAASWRSGDYILETESRLEDNAGNNLNRLFDNDLTRAKANEQKDIFKRTFNIR